MMGCGKWRKSSSLLSPLWCSPCLFFLSPWASKARSFLEGHTRVYGRAGCQVCGHTFFPLAALFLLPLLINWFCCRPSPHPSFFWWEVFFSHQKFCSLFCVVFSPSSSTLRWEVASFIFYARCSGGFARCGMKTWSWYLLLACVSSFGEFVTRYIGFLLPTFSRLRQSSLGMKWSWSLGVAVARTVDGFSMS